MLKGNRINVLGSFFIILLTIGLLAPASLFAQADQPKKDTLYVKDIVLTSNINGRQPVDTVQTFDEDAERAWCWTRIYNSGEPKTVKFVWYNHEDQFYTFPASVGTSTGWRTYSSVTLKPGPWRVEIIGPNGELLDKTTFTVNGGTSN